MRFCIHEVKLDTRVCPSGVPVKPPQLADPNETIPINKFCSIFVKGPPESPAQAPLDHVYVHNSVFNNLS